jgi:hypothetical protein
MTLHKYWNAPVHTADEAPIPVEGRAKQLSEVAPVASVATPAITHVWLAKYAPEDDETQIRAFFTEAGCQAWRQEIARDNWNTGEEEPEDAEEAADRYFDYNDCDEFDYEHVRIR